jgi:hypothetical protein
MNDAMLVGGAEFPLAFAVYNPEYPNLNLNDQTLMRWAIKFTEKSGPSKILTSVGMHKCTSQDLSVFYKSD